MKFQSKNLTNSINYMQNHNSRLNNNLIDSILNKKGSNKMKYLIKVNDEKFYRPGNVFQEWFTMNDKAILNLQINPNSNPLYKDVVRKVLKK